MDCNAARPIQEEAENLRGTGVAERSGRITTNTTLVAVPFLPSVKRQRSLLPPRRVSHPRPFCRWRQCERGGGGGRVRCGSPPRVPPRGPAYPRGVLHQCERGERGGGRRIRIAYPPGVLHPRGIRRAKSRPTTCAQVLAAARQPSAKRGGVPPRGCSTARIAARRSRRPSPERWRRAGHRASPQRC